jgi:hypothetical protein
LNISIVRYCESAFAEIEKIPTKWKYKTSR